MPTGLICYGRERRGVAKVLIEDFPHGPGGHCGTTAMRDMLKFYGHEYSEDMVFGLAAGIDFMYIRHEGIEPPVYIGGRSPDLEQNLCERLGVGMELVTGTAGDEAWLAVKKMLDEGTPAMVHADVYYLDYLRAKRHFSAHRIILVGYDDDARVAFVADNDRDTIQECSLASLAEARSAAYLPRPADNAYYRFDVPGRLTPTGVAVKASIASAVRQNVGLRAEEASFEFGDAKVGLGTTGLGEFVADMPAYPREMSAEMLSLLCKTVYVSAEKGGTGYGGNFRRMYGRFLQEASALDGFSGLAPIGDEFVGIGDRWTGLSLIFKDNSGEGGRAVELAHPMALEIHERESIAFNSLDDFVRGCKPVER